MKMKKWINTLGRLLMLASFVFIGRKVWLSWDTVKGILTEHILVACLICVAASAVVVCFNAFYFTVILSGVSGRTVKYREIAPTYLKSNLYKYLPGNVMHYIGRNKIAEELKIGHAEVAESSVLEIVFSALCAFLGGCLFSWEYAWTSLKKFLNIKLLAILFGIAVTVLCVLIAVCYKTQKGKAVIERVTVISRSGGIKKVMIAVPGIFLNLFFNGCIFTVLLYKATDGSLGMERFLTIAGISMIAWLIGFVTPGAPGGMGVREAMLSILLSNLLNVEFLSAVAVLYRIISIFGDLLSALVTELIVRKLNSNKTAADHV